MKRIAQLKSQIKDAKKLRTKLMNDRRKAKGPFKYIYRKTIQELNAHITNLTKQIANVNA